MPRSRRSKDPELRARFLREALEAKRLGLHRHGELQGRNLPPAQVRRIERQMARLAADGATYREIGDIFGYGTESVSKMLKRGRDNVKIEGVEEGKSDDDDDEEEESEQEPKPKPKVKKSRPGREVGRRGSSWERTVDDAHCSCRSTVYGRPENPTSASGSRRWRTGSSSSRP